jgi:hypothetical protein
MSTSDSKEKPKIIEGRKFWKSYVTTSKRKADEIATYFRLPVFGGNRARVIKEGRYYAVYVSFTAKGARYMSAVTKQR